MARRQLILPLHDYYLLLPQLSYHLRRELTQKCGFQALQ